MHVFGRQRTPASSIYLQFTITSRWLRKVRLLSSVRQGSGTNWSHSFGDSQFEGIAMMLLPELGIYAESLYIADVAGSLWAGHHCTVLLRSHHDRPARHQKEFCSYSGEKTNHKRYAPLYRGSNSSCIAKFWIFANIYFQEKINCPDLIIRDDF